MDELWVWTTTDDDGTEGVAYVEMAGGTRIPLIAPTSTRARAFRPIVQTMVKLTKRPWTLRCYTGGAQSDRIAP